MGGYLRRRPGWARVPLGPDGRESRSGAGGSKKGTIAARLIDMMRAAPPALPKPNQSPIPSTSLLCPLCFHNSRISPKKLRRPQTGARRSACHLPNRVRARVVPAAQCHSEHGRARSRRESKGKLKKQSSNLHISGGSAGHAEEKLSTSSHFSLVNVLNGGSR